MSEGLESKAKTWRKAWKKPVQVEFREVKDLGEEIKTREGTLVAFAERDYIIKGVEGEIYPIKKQIFEKTYSLEEPYSYFAMLDLSERYKRLEGKLEQARQLCKNLPKSKDYHDVDEPTFFPIENMRDFIEEVEDAIGELLAVLEEGKEKKETLE